MNPVKQSKFSPRLRPLAGAVIVGLGLTLSACGGGGGSGATPSTYTIGGTLSGLAAGQSVSLLNNGGDALGIVADGSFQFATPLASGANYAVTVGTQPDGQTCTVTKGSGTVDTSNISTVQVNCVANILPYAVLHSFAIPPDGANPVGGLLRDASGNLYGATQSGGGGYDMGTVFKITPTGDESVVYSFTGGSDGAAPSGGLVMDASGNLYGMTNGGGASGGKGTVFMITPEGHESVVHSFGTGTDGASPFADLVLDASGNLYGTTSGGGENKKGTVFMITPNGHESVVHSFAGGPDDGATPVAGLVLDASGNLYGTTGVGGANNKGTVFKINPNTGAYNVLHSFGSSSDGIQPMGRLLLDASGNLYGTTVSGGAKNYGTVFKFTPGVGESVVYSFTGGSDGAYPFAGLVLDANGNLYGTTYGGGANDKGTVFMITPNGHESILHSFAGGPDDGATPSGELVSDASGNLYGTTYGGGANDNGTDGGTVFRLPLP